MGKGQAIWHLPFWTSKIGRSVGLACEELQAALLATIAGVSMRGGSDEILSGFTTADFICGSRQFKNPDTNRVYARVALWAARAGMGGYIASWGWVIVLHVDLSCFFCLDLPFYLFGVHSTAA